MRREYSILVVELRGDSTITYGRGDEMTMRNGSFCLGTLRYCGDTHLCLRVFGAVRTLRRLNLPLRFLLMSFSEPTSLRFPIDRPKLFAIVGRNEDMSEEWRRSMNPRNLRI